MTSLPALVPLRRPRASSWKTFGTLTATTVTVLCGRIEAVDYVYDNAGVAGGAGTTPASNWGDPTVWNPDGIPDDILDNAIFQTAGVSSTAADPANDKPIDLQAQTWTIGELRFTGGTANRYRLQNGGLNLLSILQTGDDPNQLAPTASVTAGSNTLFLGVTSNTLGLQGPVTATDIRKGGFQQLRLGTSATAFENAISGTIFLDWGTLQASANAATVNATNNPLGGSGTELIMQNATLLDLQSQGSFDYERNVTVVGPIAQINISRAAGALTNQINSIGNLTINGNSRLVTVNNNGFQLAADTLTLSGNAILDLGVNTSTGGGSAHLTVAGPVTGGAGTSITKVGGSALILNGDSSGTFSGPLNVVNGSVTFGATGSAGSGIVTIGDNTVGSGFTNFALNRPNTAVASFNAAGASANATVTPDFTVNTASQLDLNATPLPTDTFFIRSGGVLQGDSTQLGALTFGVNVNGEAGAILAFESNASAIPVGLPPAEVVFYGLGANLTNNVTVGDGTPFMGISSDRSDRTLNGVDALTPVIVTVNGGDNNPATIETTFQAIDGTGGEGLHFGTTAGGDATYNFVSGTAGQLFTVAITGFGGVNAAQTAGGFVTFEDNAATSLLASAVDRIVVQSGGLQVRTAAALGGVPVDVLNTGSLDIGSGAALDGAVNIQSGGVLLLNDNTLLTGSGAITVSDGGKLAIVGAAPANVLTAASSQQIVFTGANHTVRFTPSDVLELDSRVPDAGVTYAVSGGATAAVVPGTNSSVTMNTQTAGLTLVNGTLTNDGGSRGFTGPLNLNDSNVTFAATRNSTFVITSNVATAGAVTIGSTTGIDGLDKTPRQILQTNGGNSGLINPHDQAPNLIFTGTYASGPVTVVSGNLGFANGNSTINGDLTFNGAVLYLDGGGPLNGGSSVPGELTARLTDTTGTNKFANNIILGNLARIEMGLNLASDSNATVAAVTQPFVITGEVNPIDKRSMWVNRQSGTNTRVNFNDVTLNPGSVLMMDENNTDIRVAAKLAGNATVSVLDAFDFLSVRRAPSLPAFDGSNPVTLTMGRTTENHAFYSLFGPVDPGVNFNMVHGGIDLRAGASLPASGVNFTDANWFSAIQGNDIVYRTIAGTNGVASEFITGGNFTVTGPRAVTGFASDVAAPGPGIVNQVGGTWNYTGAGGVLSADRIGNDVAGGVNGVVRWANVNLSGPNLTLQNKHNIVTEVGALTVTNPNATILGNGAVINNLTAGSNNLTIQDGRTVITSSVTANNLIAAGHVLEFRPGTGNTATVTANTIRVDRLLAARDGTTNLGNTIITSPVPGALTAGLREGRINANNDLTTPNPNNFGVRLGPRVGNLSNESAGLVTDPGEGWGSNETWVYTGQFYDADGIFTFAEQIDDTVTVAVDGNEVLRSLTGVGPFDPWRTITNTSTKNGASTGALQGTNQMAPVATIITQNANLATPQQNFGNPDPDANPATGNEGWHDIEIRFAHGGGGSGPVPGFGWGQFYGFGLNTGATTSLNGADYVKPLDNGSMNLFRTTVLDKGGLQVDGDATLRAGGFNGLGTITFGGTAGTGLLDLDNTGAAVNSTADAIDVVAAAITGNLEISRATDSVTVGSLTVGAGATFTTTGAGKLTVSGTQVIGTGSTVNINGGIAQFDGTGTGAGTVNVNNDAVLQGNGGVAGPVNINDGTLSPGASPGDFSTGDLTIAGPGALRIEIGGTSAGTQYDQVVTAGTVTLAGALEGSLINGFTPAVNDIFFIILNDGVDPVSGTFAGLAEGAPLQIGGSDFTISYAANGDGGGTPNDVALLAVPEPTSFVAVLSGLGMLCGLQRFRRRG